ncbi:MAG: ThiF family adenylyltransferase, partial [Chloroflexota bacterium]|nr:ThiF family adenylyltransferase [Chloroflexota bacterium]
MTDVSWIARHPQWYVEERRRLAQHYPQFWVDEALLDAGRLALFGELLVRPPGGTRRYPVGLLYPNATPFEKPIVLPLEALPERDAQGRAVTKPVPKMHDHRHQMPDGELCLFQRETRLSPAGDIVSGIDALRRATQWFLGAHTGHWPPDSAESELEAHFYRVTDVLLAGRLLEAGLEGGHGKFFFTRDYRRIIDVPTDDAPMIVTSLTIDRGGLIQVVDLRDELGRTYPWIRNEAWGTTDVIRAESGDDSGHDLVDHGFWWSLPEEPRPFSNGEGFLRELGRAFPDRDPWDVVSAALGTEITTRRRHFFAFRYPGRDGLPEWLMLIIAPQAPRADGGFLLESDLVKRQRFEAASLGVIRTHAVRPTDLRLRNTGVIDPGAADKSVGLIGLGALGSEVAELLAKAGVGRFRLCDLDRLSVGNVARHVGGVADFGAAKSRVVASRLLQINPHLTFTSEDLEPWSATTSVETLTSFISDVDLVVATAADESVESLVNEVAVRAGKPVLYGRALRRADLGRVFLARPGQDACKNCLAIYAEAGRDEKPVPDGWIDVRESPDDALLHECGRPVIAGSGIDLSFVATLVARVALTVLEGTDEPQNHWLWSKQRAPDVEARLDRELSTVVTRLDPSPTCPVCAAPEVTRLLVPRQARDEIV